MSDIAVIGGTDRQGLGLALRWATAGFDVTIGSRDGDRARAVAAEARARLEALRRAARLGAASNTDAAGSSPAEKDRLAPACSSRLCCSCRKPCRESKGL